MKFNKLLLLSVIFSGLLLTSCTQLASMYISQVPEVDEVKLNKAQSYGYFARFTSANEEQKLSNSIFIEDISLTRTRDNTIARVIANSREGKSKILLSVFEASSVGLYIVELEVYNLANEQIVNEIYSFKSARDLYSVIPLLNGMPLDRIADYLVSFRSEECKKSDFVTYNDKEFLDECLIIEGLYKVEKWVSFDNGFYFPKVFSFKDGWDNTLTLTSIMAKEFNKTQFEKLQLLISQELQPKYESLIKSGKIEKVEDLNEVRIKFSAIIEQEIL